MEEVFGAACLTVYKSGKYNAMCGVIWVVLWFFSGNTKWTPGGGHMLSKSYQASYSHYREWALR